MQANWIGHGQTSSPDRDSAARRARALVVLLTAGALVVGGLGCERTRVAEPLRGEYLPRVLVIGLDSSGVYVATSPGRREAVVVAKVEGKTSVVSWRTSPVLCPWMLDTALVADQLYVAAGALLRVDARTGRVERLRSLDGALELRTDGDLLLGAEQVGRTEDGRPEVVRTVLSAYEVSSGRLRARREFAGEARVAGRAGAVLYVSLRGGASVAAWNTGTNRTREVRLPWPLETKATTGRGLVCANGRELLLVGGEPACIRWRAGDLLPWARVEDGSRRITGVEVAAGRAVVTVSGGTLIGVDLGSGRPLWAAALPDVASGRVKRFDAAEAARLTGPRLVSWWGGLMQPPAEPRRGVHGPVGPGYGAPNSLITYAVDLGSGTVVWARPVWPLRERRIAPAGSSGGQVKYGVEPQAHGTFLLTAFRREDGGVVWETPVAEPLQTDYVWITEDAIAFVESSTAGPALTVRCLDGKRGRELWRIEGFERLLDRLLSGVHTAA